MTGKLGGTYWQPGSEGIFGERTVLAQSGYRYYLAPRCNCGHRMGSHSSEVPHACMVGYKPLKTETDSTELTLAPIKCSCVSYTATE